ncbi:23S rRNA (uracil-C(5))-methyltransferase RlmCD [Legionella santicrucis]|uniref:23S rRNA (Uracil-C(5))-methyltransferase RlmCD n=1 Tax=Legionella santicrucis TaxID=45074 RepID=A0A0W0YFX3_9GAMM|nr:RsmD family RNA methyltransferase [Legionella santicrucis]KTD55857.1 23S rRNA (uracil-C(5))-methyltransferase RlmCD [Legionella santicrucis]
MTTACPFGYELQRYWDKRFDYFSKFSSGIQMDAEALHTVVPELIARQHASLIPGDRILDAFAGVGGASIAFACEGKQIIAVEYNQQRLNMLIHNAKIYGVASQITPLCASIFDIIESLQFNSVYLDPPWGWPSRNKSHCYALSDFPIDIRALLSLCRSECIPVFLRTPKHFSVPTNEGGWLFQHVHTDCFDKRVISLLFKVNTIVS